MKFNLIGLSILIIPFLIIGCDSNSSESSHLENTNSQQTNNELIIVPYSKEETPKVYKQWGSKWVERINQMMPQAVEKIKGNPKCDAPGVCQHSCHPYLNQATETSLALTRLDRRTGLRAVGSTGEQFLTALPFQRAGFTCFAITSTDSRLARISPSLSV